MTAILTTNKRQKRKRVISTKNLRLGGVLVSVYLFTECKIATAPTGSIYNPSGTAIPLTDVKVTCETGYSLGSTQPPSSQCKQSLAEVSPSQCKGSFFNIVMIVLIVQ